MTWLPLVVFVAAIALLLLAAPKVKQNSAPLWAWLGSALILLAGVLCLIAYNLIGSTVDSDGRLNEPFALLPIGVVLLTAGAVVAAITLTAGSTRRPQTS